MTLTYQEVLDRSSTPLAGNFGVTVEGERRNVSAVLVAGSTVSLSLSWAAEAGEAVTVSYSVSMEAGAKTVRDLAGNDASGFTERPVTNSTGDRGKRTSGTLPSMTVRQIETLLAKKAQRTRAQRKVSSQLLDAGSRLPARAPAEARRDATETAVPRGLVTVDIRADVTPAVLARIEALGGTVVNSVSKYRAIRARLPLAAVEPLARLDAVQFIRPADQPITNQVLDRSGVIRALDAKTKVDTTEGDVAHKADLARRTHSVDGTGIGIGVLSDGVASIADRQATGDLPARVTVLPGQEGGESAFFCGHSSAGAEGSAMLEIVHDLAPGAELFFATGTAGPAQMAQNIEDLCAAGADVIVDDISYLAASPFQDDVVAQGISAAVANGCFYFSSAGNGGNLNDSTASVWEGDFAAGPALDLREVGAGAAVHDFGGGVTGNQITKKSVRPIVLKWADPVGGSANDYDLFLIDANNNVLASSTNTQDGTQDPIEFILSPVPIRPHRQSGRDRQERGARRTAICISPTRAKGWRSRRPAGPTAIPLRRTQWAWPQSMSRAPAAQTASSTARSQSRHTARTVRGGSSSRPTARRSRRGTSRPLAGGSCRSRTSPPPPLFRLRLPAFRRSPAPPRRRRTRRGSRR